MTQREGWTRRRTLLGLPVDGRGDDVTFDDAVPTPLPFWRFSEACSLVWRLSCACLLSLAGRFWRCASFGRQNIERWLPSVVESKIGR